MKTLAPWRRNIVALALGVTLKASGTMKWTANIDVQGATPKDSTVYSICPLEADSESDAARVAATNVARALYGVVAEPSFVNDIGSHVYMANVGVYVGEGVTRGKSLRILIREYHGAQ